MKKKYLLFLLVLVFVISGCATRTRIGTLIPAHHLSNQRSGEEVWLHVARIQAQDNIVEAIAKECIELVPLVAPLAVLGSMAVNMGIDIIKTELQEEAKNYEASYGAKAWLTTHDLKNNKSISSSIEKIDHCGIEIKKKNLSADNGITRKNLDLLDNFRSSNTNHGDVVVIISRWVDESRFLSAEPKEYENVIRQIKKYAIVGSDGDIKIIPAQGSTKSFKDGEGFESAIKGKKLAFAYALSFHPADSKENSPFLVKPMWKWQWLAKAKVVDFNLLRPQAIEEIPAIPIAFPIGLLLKTGSILDYNIRLGIDFLALGKTKTEIGIGEIRIPQMVPLGLNDPIAGPEKHDLSGTKQYIEYTTPPIIGWMAIPGYPDSKDIGYLSLHLTVNESDPSNVKKTILKYSDKLEANRDDIVNRLNPLR